MRVIDEAFAGGTIELAVGQLVELRLKENPTTGYRWRVQRDGAPACRILKDVTLPDEPAVPGRGGARAWQIEAIQAGSAVIALASRRPGEAAAAPAASFELRIRVTG